MCTCTYLDLPGDHDGAGRCQSLLGQSGPMTHSKCRSIPHCFYCDLMWIYHALLYFIDNLSLYIIHIYIYRFVECRISISIMLSSHWCHRFYTRPGLRGKWRPPSPEGRHRLGKESIYKGHLIITMRFANAWVPHS